MWVLFLYTFLPIIAMKVLSGFRNKHGIFSGGIRENYGNKVIDLTMRISLKGPFAHWCCFECSSWVS